MNKREHNEYLTREHDRRMADADTIEIQKRVDSLGNVDWHVMAFTVYPNYCGSGQPFTQYIGGMSCASYESATRAAHRYALLPGSHTLSQRIPQ